MTELKKLSAHAAMALRDATSAAIKNLEKEIERKPDIGLRPDAFSYFERLHADQLAAIIELKKFNRLVHKRVFDAFKDVL